VEAQQWKRVASALSIEEAETYHQQSLPGRKRHHTGMTIDFVSPDCERLGKCPRA
jgi:hypothetical protein